MAWIVDETEIDKVWESKYKQNPGIPKEIIELPDGNEKERLNNIWRLLYVNFGKKLDTGEVMNKKVNSLLYKYAYSRFCKENNGVNSLVKWFSDKNLILLFDKQTIETFIKSNKKEEKK